MANLFIGFPVPRAKIADMIIGSAPPLEHVANHLPDGSDPIVLPGDISTSQIVQWNGSKFIGSAAPGNGGYPSPISIHACHFNPVDDQLEYFANLAGLRKRVDDASGLYYAPVDLPHGVTVTKFTLFAYLDHVDTKCWCTLYRVSNAGAFNSMAAVHGEWVTGDSSGFDDSINYATIDNANYSYCMYATIDPYMDVVTAILRRVMIDFT